MCERKKERKCERKKGLTPGKSEAWQGNLCPQSALLPLPFLNCSSLQRGSCFWSPPTEWFSGRGQAPTSWMLGEKASTASPPGDPHEESLSPALLGLSSIRRTGREREQARKTWNQSPMGSGCPSSSSMVAPTAPMAHALAKGELKTPCAHPQGTTVVQNRK